MHPFFLHELKQAGNVHRFRHKKWLSHHFRDTAIFFALTEGAEKILKEKKNPKPDDSFIYKSIEERLKNVLGTKTKIKAKKGGKGTIEIEYSSNDELDRITTLLYSAK